MRKSNFAKDKVNYLGYILSHEGIKPQPKKVSAILTLKEPQNVKILRRFLGMVQYYCDVWKIRSHMIAPLTDLLGEVAVSKTEQKLGFNKRPWYWNDTHQA